jgi:hypothetical protein
MLTVPLFIGAYVAGAGLLAFWFDTRFPRARPTSWPRMGVAVGVSMVLDDLCTSMLGIGPRVVGVIGFVLPAVVITLLVSIWLLRMMRSAMPA